MSEGWNDPESPWWAKVRRAQHHVTDVRQRVAEFEATSPWSVVAEPGPGPGQTAYRLRVHRSVPADLITVLGDVFHNLRSSLDALAFELARRHVDGTLTAEQEEASGFPIRKTPALFEEFFNHKQRSTMYGAQEIKALRCVQPFALAEEAAALGVVLNDDPEQALRTDKLHRLHRLSVIDKHRRLPMVSYVPGITYWSQSDAATRFTWQAPTVTEPSDGALLGVMTALTDERLSEAQVVHELHLTLLDDPGFRRPLDDVLDGWLHYVGGWALPRVMAVAAGNEPPIVITTADPGGS